MKTLESLNQLKVNPKFIGVHFEDDGKTLKGTDCCGLSCLFLKEHFVDIKTDDYQNEIKNFVRYGKAIYNINEIQPLDLVFFDFGPMLHVGVYVGYNKILHISILSDSVIDSFSQIRVNKFIFAIRPTELTHNNNELYNRIKDRRIGVIGTIAAWVAGTVFAAVKGTLAYKIIYAVTYIVVSVAVAYAVSAISQALAPKAAKPNFGSGGAAEGSPHYGFGALQNTTTSELPIPVQYGESKVAGNVIYQSDPAEEVLRCNVIGEGEINSITDIRINDVPIEELPGCSVTTYLGTTTQAVDSRLLNKISGLRNVAYLALTLKTSDKLKGGFPTVTSIVQGLKIRTWDGLQWVTTKTYSNNPAACIRDFLTDIRYGVGLPESLIDDVSFGEVYDYCNISVGNNQGGTEARYTLNFILDTKKPAIDSLADLLITCNGFLLWSGSKLKLKTEKVENVTQNFNMSNIVEKSFSYQYAPKDEMINRVKLQYIDPTQNYTKVYAIAENKTEQDDRAFIEGSNGVIEKEFTMLGVTRFTQASRLANTYLKGAKANPILCKFKAGIYAIHCEPGDVISVSHDVPNWTNKLFRVYNLSEEANDEIGIVCKEYNQSVFDDSYGSSVVTYRYGTPPNYLKNNSEVSQVVLTEMGWLNDDGVHVANIDVSWTAPLATDYLTGYYIEWSKSSADYVFAARAEIGATSVRLPNATVGATYTIKVKTVNYYGIYSSAVTTSDILIIGKDNLPSNVTGFQARQLNDSLYFNWNAPNRVIDPDIHHYVLKVGSSWDSGTIINSEIKELSYTYRNIIIGTFTYWIKVVDNSGNYCLTASSSTVTIEGVPFRNEILSTNEHTSWLGTKNHLSISGNYLSIDEGYLSGDYLTDWTYVGQSLLGKVGIDHILSSSGDKTWDTDGTTSWDTYSNLRWTGFDVNSTLDIQVQVSGDSGISGDWNAWDYVDYTFSYYRLKVTATREDINTALSLVSFTHSVDVVDIDEFGQNTFVPIGGKTVTYSKTFHTKPTVSLSVLASGDGILRVPQVSGDTTTGFTAYLYRVSNQTPVQGNINWTSHGW